MRRILSIVLLICWFLWAHLPRRPADGHIEPDRRSIARAEGTGVGSACETGRLSLISSSATTRAMKSSARKQAFRARIP